MRLHYARICQSYINVWNRDFLQFRYPGGFCNFENSAFVRDTTYPEGAVKSIVL